MSEINRKINRSPLFYVGDKYKLMKQLIELFPSYINNFYEPFTGGGTVFLNLDAKKYFLNDIDKHLVNIHKYLISNASNREKFFKDVSKIIKDYNLSKSFEEDVVPKPLKLEFKKTYYAKYNKEGYDKLKLRVNNFENNDPLVLYILLIYGFNRMLRFNGGGKFNLPVGNVDFNKNVVSALNDYFDFFITRKVKFTSIDFRNYFEKKVFQEGDFVYLDPPYLITFSEYNKNWGEKEEMDLLEIIDHLNDKGVKFALSNVIEYRGKKNTLLINWMKKYTIHSITSNYISYHNNNQKDIKEVLITNY